MTTALATQDDRIGIEHLARAWQIMADPDVPALMKPVFLVFNLVDYQAEMTGYRQARAGMLFGGPPLPTEGDPPRPTPTSIRPGPAIYYGRKYGTT